MQSAFFRHHFHAILAAALLAGAVLPAGATERAGYAVMNGDVDGDLDRDLVDAIGIVKFAFGHGREPVPLALCGTAPTAVRNGDIDGSGRIGINDAIRLVLWLFSGRRAPVAARDPATDVRVVPIDAEPYGTSYGDWGLAWWKWALELPRENHPVWDQTGADCGEGQSGPVWYLAGTFGGPATRTECVVPAGKTIFMPLLNWSAWTPEDLDAANSLGVPGDSDVEKLQNLIEEFVDQTFGLEVTVDGLSLDLDGFRAASSGATSVTLSDALEEVGYAPGLRELLVANGHYVTLAPLPPGAHRIEFSSHMECAGGDECFGLEFAFDVGPIVYELVVE